MDGRLSLTFCIGLLGASFASAQEPAAPKPGPEYQRLGYFVGNWTTVGEMKPGEMGPGGPGAPRRATGLGAGWR